MGAEASGGAVQGAAFGVEVAASFEVPGLAAVPADPPARLRLDAAPDGVPPAEGGERLLERLLPGGDVGLAVDRTADGRYRLEAPGLGAYELAADGRAGRCSLPRAEPWMIQRLLFAQALPLAATLQGLELLHASAVAAAGAGAIAFVGASGAGKTSLAAAFVAEGARWVTDDVLALAAGPDGVRAFPGGRLANVREEVLAAIPSEARGALGERVGESDKVHLSIDPPAGPLELAAIVYVERGPEVPRLEVRRMDPPDPRLLLASAYIRYVADPARLMAQLDACGHIAARVPVLTAAAPRGVGPPELADAIRDHLSP